MTVHVAIMDPDLDPADNCIKSINVKGTMFDLIKAFDPFAGTRCRKWSIHNIKYAAEAVYKHYSNVHDDSRDEYESEWG